MQLNYQIQFSTYAEIHYRSASRFLTQVWTKAIREPDEWEFYIGDWKVPRISLKPKSKNSEITRAVIRIETESYQRIKAKAKSHVLCQEEGVNGCK